MKPEDLNDNYNDIINLSHHVSKQHPPMSMMSRAAQFAPFAAVSGHHAALDETAKQVEEKMERDDS
ncbi:MAG: hypothetical protein IKP54_03050 [Bacteroidales bacterium]|nr:hypothetical protein [Bacteroidales bacterium]